MTNKRIDIKTILRSPTKRAQLLKMAVDALVNAKWIR